ncbi:MAG: S8 family serine peptidase [Gammaproteobacteria bacterium]|nr:S8 family serine peptidase [Gammaproteobacteria bacterium]
MALASACRWSLALAGGLLLGACGGGGGEPAAPVTVTLSAVAEVHEERNAMVRIDVRASSTSHQGLAIPLEYSGTATRDHDYAGGADTVVIPPNGTMAGTSIDVFRDFEMEGDETIVIALGPIRGNAQPGAASRVTVTILDGQAAAVDKTPPESAQGGLILPAFFAVTEASVEFTVVALTFPGPGAPSLQLVAEWSGDAGFATDVNELGVFDIPVFDPGSMAFFPPYSFSLPLQRLPPLGSYFVRVYLDDGMSRTVAQDDDGVFRFSFATDFEGRIVTRCESPNGLHGGGGPDPLFAEQWHLRNTGQTGFSRNGGTPGADMRMSDAIRDGHNGSGVRLAVVDTGLEICHPDLAANVEPGQSFNFLFGLNAGASLTDPFNFDVLGDHGTSVAGVAAAVANNGVGGRGVASGVALRGYNVGGGFSADPEIGLLQSLGGSRSFPDSASADVFNMSFGTIAPAQNAEPDFVRLLRMGTSELRSGRGALYVKAAGNGFGECPSRHPLNAEIGCLGSNSDVDQNLPYLINVGAFNARDVKASYSSAGANLWVVAPGGEGGIDRPGIITTDQAGTGKGYARSGAAANGGNLIDPHGDYTSTFGGTSSAAPATAGAIAVLLGVNPELTWRDVRHILASTARQIDPGRAEVRAAFNGRPYIAQHAWQTNAAGYDFHNWYGFGALALDEAVAMAATHVPGSLGAFSQSAWFPASDGMGLSLPIPDGDGAGVSDTLSVAGLPGSASIEAVVLEITVDHSYASDLGVTITSPSGAASVVNAPFNPVLDRHPGLRQWQLLSNAFYGEGPNGDWRIQVVDLAPADTGSLMSWRLRFHYGEHPD